MHLYRLGSVLGCAMAGVEALTSLIAHPKGLPFGDLRRLRQLTDGNLSRHLQVLQEAGK